MKRFTFGIIVALAILNAPKQTDAKLVFDVPGVTCPEMPTGPGMWRQLGNLLRGL